MFYSVLLLLLLCNILVLRIQSNDEDQEMQSEAPERAIQISCQSLVSSSATNITGTDRMAQAEWTRIFQIKARDIKQEDSWHLGFDGSLVPHCPNSGWQQYIRNTCARFKCTRCGRSWPSNRVMVVFHMRLLCGQGVVKARRFRQNCKICSAAPMEEPSITSENIDILLENLVEKIRIKCYNENLGPKNKPFKSLDVKSPHEPAHCEACIQGICTESAL